LLADAPLYGADMVVKKTSCTKKNNTIFTRSGDKLLGDKFLDDLRRAIGNNSARSDQTGLIKGKEAHNKNEKVIEQMSKWLAARRGKADCVSELFAEHEQLFEIHNQFLQEQTSVKELLGVHWTDKMESR
jgi:hypothetical protein